MQRVPPRVEYLELEPQPAARRAYTERDIQTRRLSSLNAQLQIGDDVLTKSHNILGIISIRKQAKRVKN